MMLIISLAAVGCARKAAPEPAASEPAAPASPPVASEPASPPAPGESVDTDAPVEPAPEEEPKGDAVRVRLPQPNAEIAGDTIHVEGEARAYEATVLAEVEDGHNILARGIITATAAAPEWGDFSIDLKLEKLPTNRTLMLILYVESAADGTRKELALIPLRYTGPCADNRC